MTKPTLRGRHSTPDGCENARHV